MSLAILNIKDTCTGCGACVSCCPKHALTLDYDEEGFYYPQLNEDLCIDCRLCEKTCHAINSPAGTIASMKYKAYMLKANNNEIVKKSSSGGAFTLLAEQVLTNGGVVYGARYNFEKERLEHCSTENCSFSELQKSKYIESFMGNTFAEVAVHLKNEREVLFCGTPCQVRGLYAFLVSKRIPMDRLLLVRFVCHGVPSNKFFTEYKHYEENKYGAKMTHIDFRPKIHGWRQSSFLVDYANGKRMSGHFYEFYYYYYFQNNWLLRRSCYSCRQILDEIADITIADFWGIMSYKPENMDQEGISLVMVHNDKAQAIVNKLENNCSIEAVPHECLSYIYREVKDKDAELKSRNTMMPDVIKNGYMYEARKHLSRKIFKHKMRDVIFATIRPFTFQIKKIINR